MENTDTFFVLSSSCRATKGVSRSVIIDFSRGEIFFIDNVYYDLLKIMDRKKIQEVESLIDPDSHHFFHEFKDFLLEKEIGFTTTDIIHYPPISEDHDEPVMLKDCIIEIDTISFEIDLFTNICHDLNFLQCKNWQLRVLSAFDPSLIRNIIDLINYTCSEYLEIHLSELNSNNLDELKKIILDYPLLQHVYVYNSESVMTYDVANDIPNHNSLTLGTIYYLNYPFQDGNCCGIINFESLIFNDFQTHLRLQHFNGCLEKKLTIDRFGNLKNCPSLTNVYGNVREVSLTDVYNSNDFQKPWNINKDQILICQDCEFRYCCTDCRAFNGDDWYAKPFKCNYDPYKMEWQPVENETF